MTVGRMACRKLGSRLICSHSSLIPSFLPNRINLKYRLQPIISDMSTQVSQSFRVCANVDFLFHDLSDLKSRYLMAEQLGFKAVETGDPYKLPAEELATILVKSGMKQVLINTPAGDPNKGEKGFASVPGKEAEFLEGLKLAIAYAKKLNCQLIHIMAGLVNESQTADQDKTYIENLKKAVPLLEEAGIVGVIEPINPYSVPKYYLSNYNKAVSVIESIKSKNIGLLLDVFHLQQIKGDISHSLRDLASHVKHVQVAQVPDRHEPNSAGEVNYKYVFDMLKKVGYDKWIGLEYTPAKSSREGLTWLTEFQINL